MLVPFAHAVNLLTNSNWKGRGAVPDVVVSANSALQRAYLPGLEKLRAAENAPLLAADQDRAIVAVRRLTSTNWND